MSARATGMNWAEIGRLLDRSRQNLHKRFDGLDPRPEPTERESWDTVVRRRDADSMAALEALRHRSTRATSQATDRHGRGAGEDGAP